MRKLALILLLIPACFGAISGSMIFEVQQGGSNSNGGCFKEGATGTDFTINAGKYNFANLVIDGTTNTKVTSASHNFVAADVGNCLRITAGTGFTTGVFEIISVAANAATLDRSAGTLSSTSGTFFVGGALATLAQLNTDMCSGCRAYVKADATYSIAAKITFNFTNSGRVSITGYTSTRGDGGSPTIQASGAIGDRLIDISVGNNHTFFSNFIIDGNAQTGNRCFGFIGTAIIASNLECKNMNTSSGIVLFNNVRNTCFNCYVHDSTSSGPGFEFNAEGVSCYYCTVRNLTSGAHFGFLMDNASAYCFYCVVDSLAVAASDGFEITGTGTNVIDHCVVYNVARDAIRITPVNSPSHITNCIFSTTTNGINNSSGTTLRAGDILADYNFAYNISGSAVSGLTNGSNSVALTKDPFVSVSTHDFRLNNTIGGGASVRAHGTQGSLLGTIGTFYPDGGVAQHQDPKFFGLF